MIFLHVFLQSRFIPNTGNCITFHVRAAQLRAIYECLWNLGLAKPGDNTHKEIDNSDETSIVTGEGTEASERVHLDILLFPGGVQLAAVFELGGAHQQPHLEWLLKNLVKKKSTREEEMMQALVQLAPDSPIRLLTHLQPSGCTITAVPPKEAEALVMRILHLARLACSLQLDSSQLQDALMMLRPASLEGWGLRDTAISGIDAELQVDTAEGKEEPSVRYLLFAFVRVPLFRI